MKLSVACTFAPDLIHRLARFPQVREVYGKLARDAIGGGRSSYTLRPTSERLLRATIDDAHRHRIRFNYLINAASLGGLEQTRGGQRAIRRLLDHIESAGADAVTVASPYLLKLVKSHHPRLAVRVGVFAVVDTPLKARQWADMGADTICVSAIACNRDFDKLDSIRRSVTCELQLIANASCLLGCPYELTHMQMLSQSSRSGDPLGGFCLDYCILHCSSKRLADPLNLIRATWIRPEDLHHYEALGYDSFKIVERSCSTDLLVKRVEAYVERRFDGNLLEIAGPVAQIKKEQGATLAQRLRMMSFFARPWSIRLASLLQMKAFGEQIVLHDYSAQNSPVYVDNRALDGFLDGAKLHHCGTDDCEACGWCREWAGKAVRIDATYRESTLALADGLEKGLYSGSHWE